MFYLKYHLYRNSFPVYALSRYYNQAAARRVLRHEIPAQRVSAAQRILERMTRLPLRLTWDLTRVHGAKIIWSLAPPVALHLDLAQYPAQSQVDPPDAHNSTPDSSRDSHALAAARASAAPFVSIGGDAPLRYPRIGQIARHMISCGKIVFVEMDGTLLRRRIHEFRPESHLYLVLPLHGLKAAHDLRAGRAGDFRATVESIRTARLSGFHICVETTLSADMDISELRDLGEFISNLGVDGWIQKSSSGAEAAQLSADKIAAARQLIPGRRWQTLSQLFDLSRAAHHPRFENEIPVKHVDREIPASREGVGAL